ncbi:MAG: phage holin family protein [Herbinix sp.]|nr:phage holin family protein [Herbinix sp.]
MDISNFLKTFLGEDIFPIVPACLFGIGVFIRSGKKFDASKIPNILIIIGTVLALIIRISNGGYPIGIYSWLTEIMYAFSSGAISAFISIGIFQMLKQNGIIIGKTQEEKQTKETEIRMDGGK